MSELFDPSASICIEVRWLFRKKETAAHRLNRDATWFEAIAEYKSYLKDMIKDKDYLPHAMKRLQEYYSLLTE